MVNFLTPYEGRNIEFTFFNSLDTNEQSQKYWIPINNKQLISN